MNQFIDGILSVLLIMVAFSPAMVFNLINRYLKNERGTPIFERDIFTEPLEAHDGKDDVFHNPLSVQRDHEIITNLRKVVVRTEGTPAHQTWKIKLWEFERKLQWANLKDKADGHERSAYAQ